jgi:hypothetical protein
MALNASPHPRQLAQLPLARARSIWLAQEWRHWKAMPPLPLTVQLVSTILLVYLAPLLPIVAFLLWRWASSSWAWRDRWSSIWVWTKQGSGLVALLIALTTLGAAHVWIIARLLAAVQALWEAHFPGDLSLSPLDLDALPARTLLLLPLAPLLALYYEWLDPRTCVQPRRILTSVDRAEPPPATDVLLAPSPVTHEESPPKPQTSVKSATASKARIPQQPRPRRHRPPSSQITSERVLTVETTQDARSSPPPQKKASSVLSESPAETHPSASADIDWDDLAE